MDRSSTMKINKETQALKDTLDYIDLIYIFKTFYSKIKNTCSSQVLMEYSPG